jgi:methylphosphotriester-DNA--protein-cysteine methyltransferase
MALGTMLVQSGVLAAERLAEAVREQLRSGDRLDQVLVRLGFVHRSDLLRTFSESLHLPIIDLTEAVPRSESVV